MMMIDNVVALLRPQHDRYHVVAHERADLPRLLLSQAFAFFLDLAHAYSDLGGTQAFDRDRLQNRLARVSHGFLPAIQAWPQIIVGLPVCTQSRKVSLNRPTIATRAHGCRAEPSAGPSAAAFPS